MAFWISRPNRLFQSWRKSIERRNESASQPRAYAERKVEGHPEGGLCYSAKLCSEMAGSAFWMTSSNVHSTCFPYRSAGSTGSIGIDPSEPAQPFTPVLPLPARRMI
jgi:hypothetical protein